MTDRAPSEAREWAGLLLEGTTPGPWEWASDGHIDTLKGAAGRVLDLGEWPHEHYYGGRAGHEASEEDGALIAAAPDLAREVVRLATLLAGPARPALSLAEGLSKLHALLDGSDSDFDDDDDQPDPHAELDRLAIAVGRAVLAVWQAEALPDGAREFDQAHAAQVHALDALITEARRLAGADHE